MRKIVLCLSCVICVLLSSITAWADVAEDVYMNPEDELKFVTTFSLATDLTITGGVATGTVKGNLKMGRDVDYINVAATIKKSSGTTVKTFTTKIYPLGPKYTWSDKYKLTSKGSYYMRVELKFYKSGKLLETIRKDTSAAKY